MNQPIADMIRTAPSKPFAEPETLVRCIDACLECAQVCMACADACLREENVNTLVRCIRLNLDCTDVCEIAGRMLSRNPVNGDIVRRAVDLAGIAARSCAEECAKHAGHHEHCKICEQVCRACVEACRELLAALDGEEVPLEH